MDETEVKLRAALDAFWEERAVPTGSGNVTSVDELVDPIESMTAVEVLVTLDEIVGQKLPNTVIQPGGYQTKQEFIDKLTNEVISHLKDKK